MANKIIDCTAFEHSISFKDTLLILPPLPLCLPCQCCVASLWNAGLFLGSRWPPGGNGHSGVQCPVGSVTYNKFKQRSLKESILHHTTSWSNWQDFFIILTNSDFFPGMTREKVFYSDPVCCKGKIRSAIWRNQSEHARFWDYQLERKTLPFRPPSKSTYPKHITMLLA